MTRGPAGVRMWLIEVQTLVRLLQRRVFQRMPLSILCSPSVSVELTEHGVEPDQSEQRYSASPITGEGWFKLQ